MPHTPEHNLLSEDDPYAEALKDYTASPTSLGDGTGGDPYAGLSFDIDSFDQESETGILLRGRAIAFGADQTMDSIVRGVGTQFKLAQALVISDPQKRQEKLAEIKELYEQDGSWTPWLENLITFDPLPAQYAQSKEGLIMQGIGSFLAFAIAHYGLKGIGVAAVAASPIAPPAAVPGIALGIASGFVGAAAGLDEALSLAAYTEEGFSEGEFTKAVIGGNLSGLTEMVPVARILGRYTRNLQRSTAPQLLLNVLKSAGAEGGQEMIQSTIQHMSVDGVNAFEFAREGEAFQIGAAVGGIVDLTLNGSLKASRAFRGRRYRQAKENEKDAERQAYFVRDEQGDLERVTITPQTSPIDVPVTKVESSLDLSIRGSERTNDIAKRIRRHAKVKTARDFDDQLSAVQDSGVLKDVYLALKGINKFKEREGEEGRKQMSFAEAVLLGQGEKTAFSSLTEQGSSEAALNKRIQRASGSDTSLSRYIRTQLREHSLGELAERYSLSEDADVKAVLDALARPVAAPKTPVTVQLLPATGREQKEGGTGTETESASTGEATESPAPTTPSPDIRSITERQEQIEELTTQLEQSRSDEQELRRRLGSEEGRLTALQSSLEGSIEQQKAIKEQLSSVSGIKEYLEENGFSLSDFTEGDAEIITGLATNKEAAISDAQAEIKETLSTGKEKVTENVLAESEELAQLFDEIATSEERSADVMAAIYARIKLEQGRYQLIDELQVRLDGIDQTLETAQDPLVKEELKSEMKDLVRQQHFLQTGKEMFTPAQIVQDDYDAWSRDLSQRLQGKQITEEVMDLSRAVMFQWETAIDNASVEVESSEEYKTQMESNQKEVADIAYETGFQAAKEQYGKELDTKIKQLRAVVDKLNTYEGDLKEGEEVLRVGEDEVVLGEDELDSMIEEGRKRMKAEMINEGYVLGSAEAQAEVMKKNARLHPEIDYKAMQAWLSENGITFGQAAVRLGASLDPQQKKHWRESMQEAINGGMMDDDTRVGELFNKASEGQPVTDVEMMALNAHAAINTQQALKYRRQAQNELSGTLKQALLGRAETFDQAAIQWEVSAKTARRQVARSLRAGGAAIFEGRDGIMIAETRSLVNLYAESNSASKKKIAENLKEKLEQLDRLDAKSDGLLETQNTEVLKELQENADKIIDQFSPSEADLQTGGRRAGMERFQLAWQKIMKNLENGEITLNMGVDPSVLINIKNAALGLVQAGQATGIDQIVDHFYATEAGMKDKLDRGHVLHALTIDNPFVNNMAQSIIEFKRSEIRVREAERLRVAAEGLEALEERSHLFGAEQLQAFNKEMLAEVEESLTLLKFNTVGAGLDGTIAGTLQHKVNQGLKFIEQNRQDILDGTATDDFHKLVRSLSISDKTARWNQQALDYQRLLTEYQTGQINKAEFQKYAEQFIKPRAITREVWLARKESNRKKKEILDEYNKLMGIDTSSKGSKIYNAMAGTLLAAKAGLDLSVILRQGALLGAIQPKVWNTSIGQSIVAALDGEGADAINIMLRESPAGQLFQSFGGELTQTDGQVSAQEEVYRSNLLEKVPVLGAAFRAGNRQFTTFLNLQRTAFFAEYVEVNPNASDQQLKDMAEVTNILSGRGTVRGGRVGTLGGLLFAPRYTWSRLQLFYKVLPRATEGATIGARTSEGDTPRVRDPFLFKKMAEGTARIAALWGALAAFAISFGWDVGDDPDEADFAKFVKGNTRVDASFGFGPYMRTAIRLTRQIATTHDLVDADINTQHDVLQTIVSFISYRLNPAISLAYELFERETVVGEPTELFNFDLRDGVRNPVMNNLVNLWMEDVKDAYNEWGPAGAAAAFPLTFTGISVSTYGNALKSGEMIELLNDIDYRPQAPQVPEDIEVSPARKKYIEDMWAGIYAEQLITHQITLQNMPQEVAREFAGDLARIQRDKVEYLWRTGPHSVVEKD